MLKINMLALGLFMGVSFALAGEVNLATIPDEGDGQWIYVRERVQFDTDRTGDFPAIMTDEYINAEQEYQLAVHKIFGQKIFKTWGTIDHKKIKSAIEVNGTWYVGNYSSLTVKTVLEGDRVVGVVLGITDDNGIEVRRFVERK